MALDITNAIRVELRENGTQKNGRYKKRENYYVFHCIKCGIEISFTKSTLKKVSGRCRACADKDTAKISSQKNRSAPYVALYNKFIYDRKRFGQQTDLTFEDFVKFTSILQCHYCDASIKWSTHCLQKNGFRYNLDRKDNLKGYLKHNLVVCCWYCNQLKGNRFTYEEMKFITKKIKEFRQTGGSCGS